MEILAKCLEVLNFGPQLRQWVATWYNSLSEKKKLALSKTEIIYMYGVLDDWLSCLTLNHLILIGKYFLYTNALDDKKTSVCRLYHSCMR